MYSDACTKFSTVSSKYPTFGVLEREFLLLFCIPDFDWILNCKKNFYNNIFINSKFSDYGKH
jgi:hypothetical protein